MFDLVDVILFFLISIVFSSQLLSLRNRTMDTPNPNPPNLRGRRRPLIPNLNRHQPPPVKPRIFTTTYEVTPEDITEVKDILVKARNLPLELVDIILDDAEYWVCSSTIIDHDDSESGRISIHGAREGENQFLLRTKPLGLTKWSPSSQDLWRVEATPKQLEKEYSQSDLQKLADDPLPTLEHPFRKVVFDIESCDQGWSSQHGDHGTYRSSFTWFEAGLERFDKNNECERNSNPYWRGNLRSFRYLINHIIGLPDCPDRKNNDDNSNDLDIPTCAIRPIWPSVVHDQGSAGGPRYNRDLLADKYHEIQRNKHAVGELQHHHVEWTLDDNIDPESLEAESLNEIGRGSGTGNGEFVRNLKFGDMVTVWGHARFPGWVNSIKKVQVKVYWAL
ncbi:hypothetical protein F5Y00DRAFT_86554 [Daldinia vernicosa]|uniref:uncharacterized protein n=1 Tax=Daldinia vernicosa TaxID=114800 RepID=UPI0020072F49|nr:uncharacterized protein F5Y00DRAFT_86554 [Daldinia vernicosa]KAI0848487.1 hypothetical protein F5Y00DRAFT_86554 [Daldinia vernicosa]